MNSTNSYCPSFQHLADPRSQCSTPRTPDCPGFFRRSSLRRSLEVSKLDQRRNSATFGPVLLTAGSRATASLRWPVGRVGRKGTATVPNGPSSTIRIHNDESPLPIVRSSTPSTFVHCPGLRMSLTESFLACLYAVEVQASGMLDWSR